MDESKSAEDRRDQREEEARGHTTVISFHGDQV
jgi:hypothetical protein